MDWKDPGGWWDWRDSAPPMDWKDPGGWWDWRDSAPPMDWKDPGGWWDWRDQEGRRRVAGAPRAPAAGRGRGARSRERTRSACPSPSPLQRPVHFPGRITFGQVLALVVGPLTAGETEFHLDVPIPEVQRKRDQGQTLLGDLAGQAVNLLAMQQELPDPPGRVVGPGAPDVLRDVHVVQPHLVAGDLREPVRQRRTALAQ